LRTPIIGGAVALVVLVVVVASQLSGGDSARDVSSAAPGVFSDPPFSVTLDGPLWRARTLQDSDGAQDFALVARDLPLEVTASGGSHARVAQLELRVDGRSRGTAASRCPLGRCPASPSLRFLPPLNTLPPGEHRVEIVVRDQVAVAGGTGRGEHVTTVGFGVHYVKSVPPTREGETISKLTARSTSPGLRRLRRDGLKVIGAARRGGGIGAALGISRLRVVQAGRLEAAGRPLGVTMLVTLSPPAYGVRATVPAYVPIVGSGTVRYVSQEVRMRAAVLRDVLIDVDLASRRVISLEPGPNSRTSGWSPEKAPAPAGARDED
jgi:hypothetical protein